MMKEYFSRLPLPECAVKVNDEYLERTIVGYRTSSVSGRNELSSDLFEKTIGDTGPTKYLYKKDKTRDILVQFALVADSLFEHEKLFNKLKGVLHADNSKFVFEDEPDVYYVGTVRDITCTRLDSSGSDAFASVGEIAIHCSNPYKYSNTITTVTAKVEDGKLVANINNDGSGEVYPVYRIKHKAENGYIGIVHTGGAFEMGNIEEADKEPYEQSEQLIKNFENFSPYTGTNPQNPTIPLNGSLRQSGDYLEIENIGSTTQQWNWHGGSRRLKLPPDSEGEVGAKNFYCWWQSEFVAGRMGQTGFQQVILTDENDRYMCHWQITKADTAGNTAYVTFGIPGAAFKDFPFTPYADESNQYLTRGYEDIQKIGSQLRFYFNSGYYTVDVPEIRDKKVTYIYIVIGGLANRTGLLEMTINKVGRFLATKHHVEKERDVPNRYHEDREVVINCEDDTITLNGLPRNDEMVTGSAFYPLPPGDTNIEFYTSSWCGERPEVTVEYRKRWL